MHKKWQVIVTWKSNKDMKTIMPFLTLSDCNWVINDMTEMRNSGELSVVYRNRKGYDVFIDLTDVRSAYIEVAA